MIAIYASALGSINPLSGEDVAVLNSNFKSYGQQKR
jgi:hypothetical protein